jgi:hypothetical protein
VFQIVDFSSISDLKFTYVHLQFQKNSFHGYNPRTPMIKGREGKRGERKERRQGKERKEGREGSKGRDGIWDGVNPPKTNPGYGPV